MAKEVKIEDVNPYIFFPQCFDNQFIPASLISNFKPENGGHKNIRKKEIWTEFIRSLIYSPQVGINRVAFINDDSLFDVFSNHMESDALNTLFATESILLILFDEQQMDFSNVSFSVPERQKFFDKYISNNEYRSNINYILTGRKEFGLETYFENDFFLILQNIDTHQARRLLSMLRGSTNIITQTEVDSFTKRLHRLHGKLHKRKNILKNMNKDFRARHEAYKLWITNHDPGELLINYKKPFAVEIKKLIDLAYNYNIPRATGRYLVTPYGLPRPTLLPDKLRNHCLPEAHETYKNKVLNLELISRLHKVSKVPDCKKLTLTHITTIRSTDEWKNFIKYQSYFFSNPSTWNQTAVNMYAEHLTELYRRIELDYRFIPTIEGWSGLVIHIAAEILGHHFDSIEGLPGDTKETLKEYLEYLLKTRRGENIQRGIVKAFYTFSSKDKKVHNDFMESIMPICITSRETETIITKNMELGIARRAMHENNTDASI